MVYPKCRECGANLTTRWEISAGRCDRHKQVNPWLGMLGAAAGMAGVVLILFFVIWILSVLTP